MRTLLFSILFMLFSPAYSQGFRAYCETSGTSMSVNRDVIETSPGNYLCWAVGLSFENSKAQFKINMFGLDKDGKQKFMKEYGTANWGYFSYHFTNRSFYKHNNHVYIATTLLDSLNNYSAILLKFDFQGNLLWQKVIQDTAQQLFPMRVVSSIDGGFLITGMAQKGSHEHVFCLKTDSLGNKIWLKNYLLDIKRSQARCLLQDSATKKIIVTGMLSYSGGSLSDTKSMVIVLDSSGNQIDMKHHYSGLNMDMIYCGSGKYLMVGETDWYAQYNTRKPHALMYNINNINAPIWQYEYGTEQLTNVFNSIERWNDSTFIIAGMIDSTAIKTGLYNVHTKFSFMNISGHIKREFIYDYNTNKTTDFSQYPRTIIKTSDGGWIVPISNEYNDTIARYYKYDANGCDSTLNYCLTVGLKEQVKEGVGLFPNPANDVLQVTLPEESNKVYTIKLIDISGREVLQQTNVLNHQMIKIDALPAGLYLVKITQSGTLVHGAKLIKTD